ncbi:WhiB family transcriptional regulator [Streptomyces zaomyceticus]|uniref:WhiB family transcriptional regulator n=1 Tax=Streptomyces zaomyceticus TaxID=68286 RepID=A0ABZ1LR29_9ACTN
MDSRGTSTAETPDWRTRAACLFLAEDSYEDLMFPDPGNKPAVKYAQRICDPCPVWEACLLDALTDEGGKTKDNRYGIRGGLTPSQRYGVYTRSRQRQQTAA